MVAQVEDAKTIFQNKLNLQKRTSIINAWEENNEEAIEEAIGDISNEYAQRIQNFLDEYAQMFQDVDSIALIREELGDDGFDDVVASQIAIVIKGRDENISDKFKYIANNTDPSELNELSQAAIDMFLNRISSQDWLGMHENNKLLQKIDSIAWNIVRLENTHKRPMLPQARQETSEKLDIDEKYISSFYNPIEKELYDLMEKQSRKEATDIYSGLDSLYEEITELNKKVENLSENIDIISYHLQNNQTDNDDLSLGDDEYSD